MQLVVTLDLVQLEKRTEHERHIYISTAIFAKENIGARKQNIQSSHVLTDVLFMILGVCETGTC